MARLPDCDAGGRKFLRLKTTSCIGADRQSARRRPRGVAGVVPWASIGWVPAHLARVAGWGEA